MEPALSPIWTDQAPGELLKRYYSQGYPQLQEEDRPYHQYGPIVYSEDRWDELLTWLSGDPMLRKNLARYKQELRRQQGAGRDDSGARNKSGARFLPPEVAAPRRLLTRPIAVSLPYRPPRTGGGSEGPVVAAQVRNCSAGIE